MDSRTLPSDDDTGETADHQNPMSLLFSTRKPKDFRAGLSSGLKSVAKGIGTGMVALVAGPVIGAKQDGFTGFLKGTVAGVASAVVLPVTGVVVGTTQGACLFPFRVSETYPCYLMYS